MNSVKWFLCSLLLLVYSSISYAVSGADEAANEKHVAEKHAVVEQAAEEQMTEDTSLVKNWRPEVAAERQDINTSAEVIKNIKSKEPFINIQQKKIWDFEDTKDEEEVDPDFVWLAALISFVSMIIEAALWVLPLVIIFYLYRYREYWIKLVQGKKMQLKRDHLEIPETLFGLDIRQQSMPDNIETSASLLWQEKHYRDAVSLLYRASLAALFQLYHFELSPGATEQDCLRQISQKISQKNPQRLQQTSNNPLTNNVSVDESRVKRFKLLTDVWIKIAYAHRLPDDLQFTQVCDGWNELFHADGRA